MRYQYLLFLLFLTFIACQPTPEKQVSEESNSLSEEPELPSVATKFGIPKGEFRIDTLKLPTQPPLETFLSAYIDRQKVRGLGLRIDSIFPVKRMRASRPTYFFRDTTDTTRIYWVYMHTPERYLCVDFSQTPPAVRYDSLTVSTQKVVAKATITSSLWNAMRDAGATPELALRLSDIFAWSVDFFALTAGDQFIAVYDKKKIEDQDIGVGLIHTVFYIHEGDTLKAYTYSQDSILSYWDAAGNSLRRAFLKAPLSFTRISSHFSYGRMHPILKVVRAHTGVDYAAPMGTPVMAIGDGTVIDKRYANGSGNFVKIRHNAVYTTAYLHFSKFAEGIHIGQRVRQGDVIGYVGMTGHATGPHLDFRVWKNGTPINPLTLDSPSDAPIKDSLRAAFAVAMQQQDSILQSLMLQNIAK